MTAPLTAGLAMVVTGTAGEVRWRTAAEHAGKNLDAHPFEEIVVEMKGSSSTAPTGGQ